VGLTNFVEEFDGLSESIFNQASTHISPNEIIMTFGYSKTVLDFLVQTKKEVHFEVIVVEDLLSKSGSQMIKELKENQIICNLINENAVFAFMQTINKVLICTLFHD
jgi:translation initiation factor 2B subunit (eIF-2B alpha/beta/delta family)